MSKLEAGDGRSRQMKRDEMLRRKLENEISKRRTKVGQLKPPKKSVKTSFLGLNPTPPVTMHCATSIIDAAQFMSAKKTDCILVTDDSDQVVGIFTAKDMVFKVVGTQSDYRSMTIRSITTPDPVCTSVGTTAIEALELMVDRNFRHLPVMDDSGDIVGVLDIVECFHQAMMRLEKAHESSIRLHDALEGVKAVLGSMQAAEVSDYAQALKERTTGPPLSTLIDRNKLAIFVNAKSTVTEAAMIMAQNRVSAVLVIDKSEIIGILTTKDIVLRVIAASLDPGNCSVIRVMTPRPDCVPETVSTQEALRNMHRGHFLNLPVMDGNGEVIQILDVLELVQATLRHIKSMPNAETEGDEEPPAWNKFWMSLEDDYSDSAASSTLAYSAHDSMHGNSATEISASEIAQFNLGEFLPGDTSLPTTSSAEIGPDDSLSRIGAWSNDELLLGTPPKKRFPPVFSFKFKAPSGRVHRIVASPEDGMSTFRQVIAAKLTPDEIDLLGGLGDIVDEVVVGGFALSYIDDDSDPVAISTTQDIEDAINTALARDQNRVDLLLHHPRDRLTAKAETDWVTIAIGATAAVAVLAFFFRQQK